MKMEKVIVFLRIVCRLIEIIGGKHGKIGSVGGLF